MQYPTVYLLGCLSLASAVSAQNVAYSPATYAYHSGITSTGYPFGYTTYKKMTYQQVHGDLPGALVISKLAWRPIATSAAHGAFTATMTLAFGMNGPTPDNATASYANNLGPNPTTVINSQAVNISAYTPPTAPPADYIYALPLTTPYIYTGTGAFCWECRLHDHTAASNISFDLFQFDNTILRLQSGGQGCTASGAAVPASLTGTYTGGSLSLNAANMPTGAPSLLLVGLTGVPADLTPIGAPCMLRSHPSAVIPGTGSAGSYSWTSPLTVSAINGLAVYLQAAAPDPTANSFGLVFSSGLAVIWPYQNRPAIRNWSTNDDLATTGNLQLTYGLVIKVGTY